MSNVIDMVGLSFGRLTVVSRQGSDHLGKAQWLCECTCGNSVAVLGVSLRTGNSTSCGCKLKEFATSGAASRTHGRSGTPEYRTWKSMHNRCYNPNSDDYRNYGGCGIVICERWRESFIAFLTDMGPRPSANRDPGEPWWGHSVWRINPSNDPIHPAMMPGELVRRCLISSSSIGDTIIDPFAGAATVGKVCSRWGRKFIGIELAPTHYATAMRRLTHATGAGPGQLFGSLKGGAA